MAKLTRRALADYAAQQLIAGRGDVIDEVAAYLIASHRVRETRLIVRDIESALARRGVLVAHVATAHPLDASAKASLSELLKHTFDARTLHFNEAVEPTLLGGVKVAAAEKELDSTARRTLNQLKAVKV